MYPVKPEVIHPKALLIAVQLPELTDEETQVSLEELTSLTRTANYEIVASMVHLRRQVHPATYIGKGKLEEIKSIVCSQEIAAVVIDATLTPKQGNNLERTLKCLVLDRTQVILQIFLTHAKTREAKLQIELAQLQYMLPRLVGMWAHLDRERGGIGVSRGTGEKQIIKDRQILRNRISRLKQELKSIEAERDTQTRRRDTCFRVSLIGYTNAGKSTIMNAMTDANLLVEDKLFATLDSTTRTLDNGTRPKILLSDTVGFIKNLPHELVASFRSTLEVVRNADLLVHVVEVGEQMEEHIEITHKVLDEIQANCLTRLLVINKIDTLKDPLRLFILQKKFPEAIFVQGNSGEVTELRERILAFFEKRMETMELHLDYKNSHNLSQIYEWSRVENIDYQEDGIHLTLTSLPGHLNRIRHHLAYT